MALGEHGDVALVGAVRNEATGSAYVFLRRGQSFSEQQKLGASDAAPGDLFGDSVALSARGDAALVGAQGKDVARGAAYVF